MIKTLLLVMLISPANAGDYLTKSHCDEMYDVLRESPEYIKEQSAREIYERCLASLS